MNTEKYNMIQAEINELNKMIASTPEHFVIDRLGLESRKDELQHILDAHPMPERQPIRQRNNLAPLPCEGGNCEKSI